MVAETIRLGPFEPDKPTLASGGSSVITNAIPSANGYRPVRRLVPYTQALPGPALGAAFATSSTGTSFGFAGTSDSLLSLSGATAVWQDVSRTAGYETDDGERWRFVQFGDLAIGTNFSDPLQSFDLAGGARFGDLTPIAPLAPRARFIAGVRTFVMVAYTFDALDGLKPGRVWWSASNRPAEWPTPGSPEAAQLLSTFQDMPGDLGEVRGLASGLTSGDVSVFLERGIVNGIFTADPDLVFSFDAVEGARGLAAPDSLVQVGGQLMGLFEDGFYRFDGITATPIGTERVNDFFFRSADPNRLRDVRGFADPFRTIVFWWFVSVNSTDGVLDQALTYDWHMNEWGVIDGQRIECFARAISPGFQLADISLITATLDLLPGSLDDRTYAGGGLPSLGAFDTDHKLGTFSGPTLPATLDTEERQLNDDRRTYVGSARPYVDGAPATVQAIVRDLGTGQPIFGPQVAVSADGAALVRSTGRFQRMRVRIAEGVDWTAAQAVELVHEPAGHRRPTPQVLADLPSDLILDERGQLVTDFDGTKLRVAA